MGEESQQLEQLEEIRAQEELEAQAQLTSSQNKESTKRLGALAFWSLLIISLIADLAEAFTLGTIGWFVGLVVDAILLIKLGFSVRKQMGWLIGVVGIETIPGLDILPLRTFYLLFARYHLNTI